MLFISVFMLHPTVSGDVTWQVLMSDRIGWVATPCILHTPSFIKWSIQTITKKGFFGKRGRIHFFLF